MTDQDQQQAPIPAQSDIKTTIYLVEYETEITDDDGVVSRAWESAGELEVPRRTQHSTVKRHAGKVAVEAAGRHPVKFRAIPADQVVVGDADLEQPAPQLVIS